jgi:hypothetical protein
MLMTKQTEPAIDDPVMEEHYFQPKNPSPLKSPVKKMSPSVKSPPQQSPKVLVFLILA